MIDLRYESVFSKLINFVLLFSLLAVICFLPLIYDSYLPLPTQTGKFFFFSYSALLIVTFYILLLPFRSLVFFVTKCDILIISLFIYITINHYFFYPDYGLSIRYFELMGLMTYYMILRYISPSYQLYLLLAIAIGGIIQAVYGNLQLYGYYSSNHSRYSVTGGFFNPGPYAGYLASTFPVALGMFLFNGNSSTDRKEKEHFFKWNLKHVVKYISLIGLVTISSIIVSSQSRAAWVSIVLSGSYILISRYNLPVFVNRSFKNKLRKWVTISIALVILLSCAFGLFQYKKRSAEGRLFIWTVTSGMISDQPLIGHGFDRFKATYMHYQAVFFQTNSDQKGEGVADDVVYAFNEPLQMVAEIGVIGLILYLLILTFIFNTTGDKKNKYVVLSKAGLIAILSFSLFSYPADILPIKLNALVFMVILISYHKKVQLIKDGIRLTAPVGLKAGFICILMPTIFYFNSQLGKLYNGYEWWDNAKLNYELKNVVESIEYFDKAYPALNKEGEYLINYGKALALLHHSHKAIYILNKARFFKNNSILQTALGDCYKQIKRYDLAEIAYKNARYMVPSKFYPVYLLVKLYGSTGQVNKAHETEAYLRKKDVKVHSKAIEEMRKEAQAIIDSIENVEVKYKVKPTKL